MTSAPIYQIENVNRKRIGELFRENNFVERIPLCDKTLVYETPEAHAVFCCRQRLYRYVDRTLDEEIAIMAHITYANGREPKDIIIKLLIGGTIYRHDFHVR